MKIIHWIVAICLFTASWDILGTINVGGTLRLTQILAVLVCIAGLARMAQTGRILWPRGATALALWVFLQLCLLPLSGAASIAAQVLMLLLADIAVALAFVQLYGETSRVDDLMKLYIASFVFVALFGILQIALPIVGGPGILVGQWIIHGRFARINGFTYEPSFFATYMLIGWIMLIDLRFSGARITAGRYGKWATWLVGSSLFLSTSKVGWLFMLLEGALRSLPWVKKFLQSTRGGLRHGHLIVPFPRGRTIFYGCIVLLILGVALRGVFSVINPLSLLNGTGLGGTAAHSLNARTNDMHTTWYVFSSHPWIGHSLGGVAIELAQASGVTITAASELRQFWGFPALLEILAGSGILFFLPFLAFLYTTTIGAYRFASSRWPEEHAKWLRALARAMIFELLILSFDQNLARSYVWYHVGMVLTVMYVLEFSTSRVESRATAPAGPLLLTETGL